MNNYFGFKILTTCKQFFSLGFNAFLSLLLLFSASDGHSNLNQSFCFKLFFSRPMLVSGTRRCIYFLFKSVKNYSECFWRRCWPFPSLFLSVSPSSRSCQPFVLTSNHLEHTLYAGFSGFIHYWGDLALRPRSHTTCIPGFTTFDNYKRSQIRIAGIFPKKSPQSSHLLNSCTITSLPSASFHLRLFCNKWKTHCVWN